MLKFRNELKELAQDKRRIRKFSNVFRRVDGERIAKYGHESSGNNISPADFPVSAQFPTQHELYVPGKIVKSYANIIYICILKNKQLFETFIASQRTVEPANADGFYDNQDVDWESAEIVDYIEHKEAALLTAKPKRLELI